MVGYNGEVLPTCFLTYLLYDVLLPTKYIFFYKHVYVLHGMFTIRVLCRSVVKLRNSSLSAMVQFELHGFYQLHKSVSIYLYVS